MKEGREPRGYLGEKHSRRGESAQGFLGAGVRHTQDSKEASMVEAGREGRRRWMEVSWGQPP